MVGEIEKAKKEQDQKRKLWNEQQQARLNKIKPRFLEKTLRKEYQSRLAPLKPVQALEKATKEIEGREESPDSMSRRPEAILARLRAQRLQELKAKRAAGAASGSEETTETEEIQKTTKNLKNLYRIINGATGVTIIGLILTFFVMNTQLLLGNLLKINLIPKLSLFEIIIICVFDLVFFGILLILVALIIIMVTAITDPWELIKMLPGIAWDMFIELFK